MEKRLRYLLQHYIYNTATHDELIEFFELVRAARFDAQLAQLLKDYYAELQRDDASLTFVNQEGKLLDFSDAAPEPSRLPGRSAVFSKKWKQVLAAAALLCLAFTASYVLFATQGQMFSQEQVQVIKEAGHDENKVITLSDGTKVWLNGASRLEYPQEFTKGSDREVKLIGEAYFEVSKAADWPFIVHTGEVQTVVLGTEFNIKAYPGMQDVMVAVKSGKVKVRKENKVLATLVKNEEFRIAPQGSVSLGEERVLVDKVAGNWIAGYLEYEDESMASIVADIARIYHVQIAVKRQDVLQKMITTSMRKDIGPEHVLHILCTLTDSKLQQEKENYIIY